MLPLALGDRHDFLIINALARRTPEWHTVAVGYASLGVVAFGVLLVTGYLLARRSGQALCVARSLLAGLGVLVAVAVNQPIVHAVGEARPFQQLPGVLVLVHRSADASFPSDHAVMAGAAAVGLLHVSRRLGLIGCVGALLMAFDRVYVGAHFPLDVLAGLAVGGCVAALTQLLGRPLAAALERVRPGCRLRPPGARTGLGLRRPG